MQVEQFNRVLREFARKHVPAEVATMERAIALDALNRLVSKTPVKTGRARGGWQAGIGTTPTGQTDRWDRDGHRTISAGSDVGGQSKDPVRCVIANNVEYIERLEHGHSRQAPEGMLGVTLDELSRAFQ